MKPFENRASHGPKPPRPRGIANYYAVMPAEIIRGREKQHPEARMHGGAPAPETPIT